MADIDVHRVHNLGMPAARAAADRMAADLGRKFDLRGDWVGNVLKFERPGVTGSLAITAEDVKLSVTLGFLLKAMKGSIEKAVLHELDTLFAHVPARKRAAPKSAAKAPRPRRKTG